MAKKEAPIGALQHYLPDNTFNAVLDYLHQFHVHLTVTKERKSILGDYRHKTYDKNHRISINGNLNKYAFLITLLHEIAHLLTFEQYGNKVQSHGKEWKIVFGKLLAQFIQHEIFPEDIKITLLKTLQNPAATSCADLDLLRVLKKYDKNNQDILFVESINEGELFKTYDGKIFQRGEKVRKRFKCMELKTKRLYLFSPVYEVERVKL